MLWDKNVNPRPHKVLKYMYFCDKSHPLASEAGIVYYHRHVASEKLGRWVTEDEHVHHIDGNRQNNTPENLEVLTEAEHHAKHRPPREDKVCPVCAVTFKPSSMYVICCSKECSIKRVTKERDIAYIKEMIWKIPATALAKELGVSDSGLCKICRRHKIAKPPVGYWPRVCEDGSVRPLVNRSPKWKHGTSLGHGKMACRCELCTVAQAAIDSEMILAEVNHGTNEAYNRHGCRCANCREKHKRIKNAALV